MNQISIRWLRCQTPLLSNSGCVNDCINTNLQSGLVTLKGLDRCYHQFWEQERNDIDFSKVNLEQRSSSHIGRNTKSWMEELKGASLGASAHAHSSHWCALIGAGCFVCVASVPALHSPDWVHVMTKALGKETKKQGNHYCLVKMAALRVWIRSLSA